MNLWIRARPIDQSRDCNSGRAPPSQTRASHQDRWRHRRHTSCTSVAKAAGRWLGRPDLPRSGCLQPVNFSEFPRVILDVRWYTVRAFGTHIGPSLAVAVSAGLLALAGCSPESDTSGSEEPSVSSSSPPSSAAPPSKHERDVDPARWSPAAACPIVMPSELPDGTTPGEARQSSRFFLTSWGSGTNKVTIGRGREVMEFLGDASPSFPSPSGEQVIGADSIVRWVVAIGDPPLGQIAYKFVMGPCAYVLWTRSGLAWADALAYAERLSTPDAPKFD